MGVRSGTVTLGSYFEPPFPLHNEGITQNEDFWSLSLWVLLNRGKEHTFFKKIPNSVFKFIGKYSKIMNYHYRSI